MLLGQQSCGRVTGLVVLRKHSEELSFFFFLFDIFSLSLGKPIIRKLQGKNKLMLFI